MYCYLSAQQCTPAVTSPPLESSVYLSGAKSLRDMGALLGNRRNSECPYLNALHTVTSILFKNCLLNRGICEDLSSHQCSHSLPSHTFNKAPSWSLQMPLHSGQICALTFLPRPAQSSPSLPAPGWLAVELQPIKHCEKEGPRKASHWVTDQTQDFIIRICFVKKGDIGQDYLSLFCDCFSEIFPTGQIQKCVGN